MLLVPVVSWIAPANRNETLFVRPSIEHCLKRLDWTPELIVADMAYIALPMQKDLRERLGVGLLTKIRKDMNLVAPFEKGPIAVCPQGQALRWLEFDARQQMHWFGVSDPQPLCTWCWQQSQCPRQFSFAPSLHEILLGKIPLASRTSRLLLEKVRCWIEPAQAYEKNQLGLSQMFLNSLRYAWTQSLLADAAVLLRAHALLRSQPAEACLLRDLLPQQLSLTLT